jgi:uncharacterized protein
MSDALRRPGVRGVVGGVGIGWRPEVAAALLGQPSHVDFVEVVAERCIAAAEHRREAAAIAEVWPLVVHGVKLSLGTAAGIDRDHAARIGELARALRAPMISEHVALTRVPGREIGHLTAIPFHRDMVGIVARNVADARRRFPDVPFLLENIAWTLRYPEDAMHEGEFYEAIARATGCGLLLDVANLYANALNAGVDPAAALAAFPLERVEMVHVAGGRREGDFYFDTHAHAVPEEVFALVEQVRVARPGVPVVLERDAAFPPFAETAAELARLRTSVAPAAIAKAAIFEPAPVDVVGECRRQEELAVALTDNDEPATEAIARTRAVLDDKRIDDALPLLPALGKHPLEALARTTLAGTTRAAELVGVVDAHRVATAALGHLELAAAARRDLLILRARFVIEGGRAWPRRGPFVGRERFGRLSLWAIKGPGTGAKTVVFSHGRERRD